MASAVWGVSLVLFWQLLRTKGRREQVGLGSLQRQTGDFRRRHCEIFGWVEQLRRREGR